MATSTQPNNPAISSSHLSGRIDSSSYGFVPLICPIPSLQVVTEAFHFVLSSTDLIEDISGRTKTAMGVVCLLQRIMFVDN